MLLLAAGVELGVVRFAGDQHPEQDFEQSLSQAPQGTGVRHACLPLLLVVGLAPGAGLAKAIRPKVHGVAHELIAGPPHSNLVEFAGLV